MIGLMFFGLVYALWREREPPSVKAERESLHERYADESLITYIEGESRRHRLRRTEPGQHVRGVWARIR